MVSIRTLFATLLLLCSTVPAWGKTLLVDDARILQPADYSRVEAQLQEISQKSQSDVLIVTVTDTGGKTPEAFADDYFDHHGYGQGTEREGALLLLVTGDGTPGSRHAHISTSGSKTIAAVNDQQREKLLDALIDGGWRDNRAADGFTAYLDTLGGILYNSLSATETLGSLGAAIAAFFAKFFGTKKSYQVKQTPPVFDMARNALTRIDPAQDVFLSTNTVSRTVPKGAGASSTHTSSSGRTHGGGGRSF